MNESTKTKWLALAFLLIFAGVGATVYLVVMKPAPEPEPPPLEAAIAPAPQPTPGPVAGPSAPPPQTPPPAPAPAPVPITDELIRGLVAGLTKDTEVLRWVHREHLVGTFIALTETLAAGQSPRALVSFLAPEGVFPVIARQEDEFLDPKGYERYDFLAQSFATIDEDGAARLYRQIAPELEGRYAEMARPGQTFRQQLTRAIGGLLQVPEVDGDIALTRIEVTLKFADPDLESLSDAQKHLLRMGPGNIRVIQAKLRQLARAIGLDESIQQVKPIRCASCTAKP